MKLSIFLAIIGVIYCEQEGEEAAIDIISTKYERYGNGVECPENLELIKVKCNETGTSGTRNGTFEIYTRVVSDTQTPANSLHHELSPGDKQVKYAQLINTKLNETKMLRDRFLGYLDEAGNQSTINMGEVICIGRKYWENVVNLHDDQDGFREFASKVIDLYPEVLNRTEHLLGVKVDTNCEMKESYPEAKYKSYIVSLSRMLPKYLNITL